MQPTDSKQVLFNKLPAIDGNIGLITLNRPESLNALSKQMLIEITDQLVEWQHDNSISSVLVNSSCAKSFCAGGDIKRLYNVGPQHYAQEVEYFNIEYNLSKIIHYYPKPYICLLNGIAMGGGLGLSINGSCVIASESLKLAMPETKIGLYPDTGASYFLSRCPHNLGMYLGLTGNVIGVGDAILCGLVDAFVPSDEINLIPQALQNNSLEQVLSKYKRPAPTSSLQPHLTTIEQCFGQASVEMVLASLEQEKSAWAQEQIATILSRSPTSLKITHKEISLGKNKSIDDCLEMEFNLTIQVLQTHDLYEGIRAVLVDKTHDAKWFPARLQDVDDAYIDSLFKLRCIL